MNEHYLIIASDGTVARLNPEEFNTLLGSHEKWEYLRKRVCEIKNPKTLAMIKKLLEE